jgi:2-(1,2-epoxy-1,2-dihydrophenyl)acetyl-CoA isomerase
VAVVNGLAAGIGAATLLHCDSVVASEFAGFQFSSAKAALLPDAGVSILLAARVGQAMASEILMLGERLNPKTAERVGLINSVVPMEDLARSGRARAEALAKLPRATVRDVKRLLREPLLPALTAAIYRERDLTILAAGDGGVAPPSIPTSR